MSVRRHPPVDVSRRRVLGALCAAGSLALPGFPPVPNVASAAASGRGLSSREIADQLFLIEGAGCNVVLADARRSPVLVDGGLAEFGEDLEAYVLNLTEGRPVRTLFNTHWHWDHTGFNDRCAAAGATIVAHENTKLWMGTDIDLKWASRFYPARPPGALPTRTFYVNGQLELEGGETIRYGHTPQAHTDGDMYVFFPRRNALIAGDLVSTGSYPVIDYVTGGWIGGLAEATKVLLSVCDSQTKIIPGAGPIEYRGDLDEQLHMLSVLKERLWLMIRKGMSVADLLQAGVTREFDDKWGDPALFVANAYPGMWGHYGELGGVI
jgi:cyclase